MNAPWRSVCALGTMLGLAVAACGPDAPLPPSRASLGGAIARVGDVTLPSSLVSSVARAKGSSPREATDDLARDALAAQGAQARGFDRDPAVAWSCTAALARRVPERMADEAADLGPPTDDELGLVSVVHAVVMRSPSLREEDALAMAGDIRRAVATARSGEDFLARANAVAHPHAQMIAQPVGPFGADGRDASGGRLDAGFVAAAFALRAPLEISPIVTTPFGWHVIQLVERKAPEGSRADRMRELAEPVVRMRGRMNLDALLRAQRPSPRSRSRPPPTRSWRRRRRRHRPQPHRRRREPIMSQAET